MVKANEPQLNIIIADDAQNIRFRTSEHYCVGIRSALETD